MLSSHSQNFVAMCWKSCYACSSWKRLQGRLDSLKVSFVLLRTRTCISLATLQHSRLAVDSCICVVDWIWWILEWLHKHVLACAYACAMRGGVVGMYAFRTGGCILCACSIVPKDRLLVYSCVVYWLMPSGLWLLLFSNIRIWLRKMNTPSYSPDRSNLNLHNCFHSHIWTRHAPN